MALWSTSSPRDVVPVEPVAPPVPGGYAPQTRTSRGLAAALAGACACALAACGGGYPEPRNQLTASEAAVRAAEVAGAPNSPQSALHLKRAREQVESGKALVREGENERAEWVLRRAQSDADLALALANEEGQRKKAAEIKEELEQLRESVAQSGVKQ